MAYVLKAILLAVGAYLLGAVNASILISRRRDKGDIRQHGSGNAGATNMARVYGMVLGLAAFALDMLKALVTCGVGRWLLGDVGVAVGGLACMIGHCFPAFYHFKGGKGISVGAGLGLSVNRKVFAVILLVFLIAAVLSKRVSVGSICASAAIVPCAFLFSSSAPLHWMAVLAAILAVFQHRSNIRRILQGTEPEFRAAKRK